MAITDKLIDQAFSDLKATCGGVRNDYFGLLYLEQEFGLPRELAVNQIAFVQDLGDVLKLFKFFTQMTGS